MGGHLAGEVASAIAVEHFTRVLQGHEPSEEALHEAVRIANERVYEASLNDPNMHGMGTTLTALWFDRDYVYLSHIGDSRAYLLRNRALMQLSTDHSLVDELLTLGEITLKEARTHPHRNIITRALGTGPSVKADIIRIDAQPKDVWLLCSDGLSNYVSSPEMAEVMTRSRITWHDKIDELIRLTLSRGGSDNITVLFAVGEGAIMA
jgi:protein phosphatase